MTRLVSVILCIMFMLTFCACSSGNVNPPPLAATPGNNAQSAYNNGAGNFTAPPSATPQHTAEAANNVIQNNQIIIAPQSGNKIIITYPKHDINKNEIFYSADNYRLILTPGDYSDSGNAISTFLFDLYKKQCVFIENIRSEINAASTSPVTLKAFYFLDSIILNLGQVDILALPKFKYSEDGVPYIFTIAPAYKTYDNDIIRFGNVYDMNDVKQTSKGSFDMNRAILMFETITRDSKNNSYLTCFEALKNKNDDFTYRCLNLYGKNLSSLLVIVSKNYLQARYSWRKAEDGFNFKPLTDTPSLADSDKEYGLKPMCYIFANDDGARFTENSKEE